MFLFEQHKIIEEEVFFLFIHFLVCQMYLTIKGLNPHKQLFFPARDTEYLAS